MKTEQQHGEDCSEDEMRGIREPLNGNIWTLVGFSAKAPKSCVGLNYSESHCIQDIVREVSNARFNCSPLFVARYQVGINDRVKAMLLDIKSNDVHMVGIYGPGGIGNTTITKAIFNRISDCFEGCSYLENVSEKSMTNDGIIKLRETLLFEILGDRNLKVDNKYRGINVIKKKTLL
nr:TMV resistance protein N-like [Quercus suber]